MRLTIKKAAPKATEKISYGIPTFASQGNLVHFAAFKGAKGSVQFPLDEPLPLTLVTRIVKFRVKQNLNK